MHVWYSGLPRRKKGKGENLRNWEHFASPEPSFIQREESETRTISSSNPLLLTSKGKFFWTVLYRGHRKKWPISLCLFPLGMMIFLTRGLQKGRVCTAEVSPPSMQLFHRCSKSTCAYQRYMAVGWHRKFSLHPAIRAGASYPIPSSAWRVTLAEDRLPASAGKNKFRLSLPDIYILIVPYTGQALPLPLTNTNGKNHKTPPPEPQPRNTTPLHGLLDGHGARVTYCRAYSFLGAALLQAARHSAGAAASRGRCQPPPACDSGEQGALALPLPSLLSRYVQACSRQTGNTSTQDGTEPAAAPAGRWRKAGPPPTRGRRRGGGSRSSVTPVGAASAPRRPSAASPL